MEFFSSSTPEKHKDNIFRSKLPDIHIPNHLPLHTYCFQNLSDFPTNPCLISASTGDVLTYTDVHLASQNLAASLHHLGISHGDTIMLLLPNSTEFAISFLAASLLGAITTTANPFYTPAEIHNQAVSSSAKLIITESCNSGKVQPLVDNHRHHNIKLITIDDIHHDLSFSQLLSSNHTDHDQLVDSLNINSDDVVALPYSSGTTGLPKGVMITHKGLVTSISQQVDGENPNIYFHKEDVILCLLPLFHIYSLNTVLLCGIRRGAAIVIMRRFDIEKMMEVVERFRVTVLPMVPPIVVEISKRPSAAAKRDLSSVRMVMSGAAPMGKELQDTLRSTFPNATFGQGYGMTEAAPLSMCLGFAKEPFEFKSGSCGTVIRNSEMKFADPETGLSLPRHHPGEICVRGDMIMKGYLNDPEATKNTIDNEGWLHTGDIGFIDDDDEVFIVDRLKELIKYKAFQVAPAELEAMLISHPNISDAAVVSMKDELAGEIPVAFVVRSDGSEITEDEIKQYISKQVIFYKRIHKVFFCNAIPKAPSGKILRKDLRAKLTIELSNDKQT
ncbi:hypothetical protein J5N97_002578 [Dioscorea zingiberensis]|uniref:4-coumarate--CoA ligase n=1 Tax=Dioscorea zingiberensis TaxID=325984 RepID=A0A9D5D4J5_9LILI|nr:hypothetical protein J5N97_002578 [Dioscorea zingiberensis]